VLRPQLFFEDGPFNVRRAVIFTALGGVLIGPVLHYWCAPYHCIGTSAIMMNKTYAARTTLQVHCAGSHHHGHGCLGCGASQAFSEVVLLYLRAHYSVVNKRYHRRRKSWC
jgi:hypothetical protein